MFSFCCPLDSLSLSLAAAGPVLKVHRQMVQPRLDLKCRNQLAELEILGDRRYSDWLI